MYIHKKYSLQTVIILVISTTRLKACFGGSGGGGCCASRSTSTCNYPCVVNSRSLSIDNSLPVAPPQYTISRPPSHLAPRPIPQIPPYHSQLYGGGNDLYYESPVIKIINDDAVDQAYSSEAQTTNQPYRYEPDDYRTSSDFLSENELSPQSPQLASFGYHSLKKQNYEENFLPSTSYNEEVSIYHTARYIDGFSKKLYSETLAELSIQTLMFYEQILGDRYFL
ncbi:hypothetical protein DICVIV_11513 [Dictyocaulus viviparus]|uniref:Uncharacterized protein n=1 Tax=Dictyocaulus viviparus TaxID=29172 RepID=A0A0D8XD17_DICVI|nr:hypothetical protein DICVIV_11513 [Dictyocaulus viviparus]